MSNLLTALVKLIEFCRCFCLKFSHHLEVNCAERCLLYQWLFFPNVSIMWNITLLVTRECIKELLWYSPSLWLQPCPVNLSEKLSSAFFFMNWWYLTPLYWSPDHMLHHSLVFVLNLLCPSFAIRFIISSS